MSGKHADQRVRQGAIVTLLVLLGVGNASVVADDARLILKPATLRRVQHACGVSPAHAPPPPDSGRHGARAAGFQRLRQRVGLHVDGLLLPGEALAAAFVHRVTPEDVADAERIELVAEALVDATPLATDKLEAVLALDWCWDALPPGTRREFLRGARQWARPLEKEDSPLQSRGFRERLAALALALAVDAERDPSPSWDQRRTSILSSARQYFANTFPQYVAWRGKSPTTPVDAAREECDTALAIELARHMLEGEVWSRYTDSVGRWMEHYVYATLDHPAINHGFLRDACGESPLSPASEWKALLPLTAHLIAHRTGNPAAVAVAHRVEATMDTSAAEMAELWRWVPLVYDVSGLPVCSPKQLPLARNLDGAIVFRSGHGSETTAIWIDAGQPFLRRRQHFDAGHFVIHRGGLLSVGGYDDVIHEAVPSEGGKQRLGRHREPFDFEQYNTATIAHNCVVLWDATRMQRWYDKLYVPVGGQRCIEETCTDFETTLDAQRRTTGRTLAYGQSEQAAYVALDLTPAYARRVTERYTREFIYVRDGALLVIDRVIQSDARTRPTWVLHLPARPRVDGHPLQAESQVRGHHQTGGLWRYATPAWVQTQDRDGQLWMTTLAPQRATVRIVGGPAETQRISDGPHAGRTYTGGTPDGYERLTLPAECHGVANAWYRLGEPTLLGSTVGKIPLWGRIEVEPAAAQRATVFVHAMVARANGAKRPPTIAIEQDAQGFRICYKREAGAELTVHVPDGPTIGGQLRWNEDQPREWQLPDTVATDPPLVPVTES